MASFGCQIGLCTQFTYWTVFLPISITMKSCGSRNKRLATTLSLVSTSLTNLAVSFVHLNKFDVLTFKQRLAHKQGSHRPQYIGIPHSRAYF